MHLSQQTTYTVVVVVVQQTGLGFDTENICMYIFISGIKPIAQHTNKLTKRTELLVTTNRNSET